MRFRARAALPVLVLILAGASLQGAEADPITVGLIPDGLSQQERAPLRDYLSKAMGRQVNLVAPDIYSETVIGLADGSYDFACLGALMYVRARAKLGVVPLVQRVADLRFHSVFITGSGSSINSLGDLKGKQFAFGDIASASAHLMPYRELKEAGVDPERDLQVRYSGSHPATAAMVQAGVVDAGVLDETVYNSMIQSGKIDKKKVRAFYTSRPFVDYVYVARKDVPEAERERFSRALLALREGGDDAILKVLRGRHFVVANDQEYATVRQIARELKMF
ncbi:MAG: phosphate/phosphite/phosphonate ABC transporter substrate-binding protein [Candidatus Sulfotelmatobacter sp.]